MNASMAPSAVVLAALSPAGPPASRPGPTVLVELERFPAYTWILPNGEILQLGGGLATTVDAGDPAAVEVARRHHEEMKQLIAERKGYQLHRAFGQEKWGGKRYEYWFTYADGTRSLQDFEIPLNRVRSWQDYLEKREAQERQRYRLINQAILAGRYRLKHTETRYSFLCHDAGSFETYRVQFEAHADGRQIARIWPAGQDDAGGPGHAAVYSETTWLEHLEAVRSGKREVMEKIATTTDFYEIDLANRARTYLPCRKPLR